jgi:hypothetical protein
VSIGLNVWEIRDSKLQKALIGVAAESRDFFGQLNEQEGQQEAHSSSLLANITLLDSPFKICYPPSFCTHPT